jgi:hypothetical protein
VARRKHNTQTPRDRRRLVEDFEQRVRYDRELGDLRHLLERPRSLAWVVHPLADEADLLAELAIMPENCLRADAYWRYGESVYFDLFISSTPPIVYNSSKPPVQAPPHSCSPGIYYRFDKSHRQDIFDIFLPGSLVESADLHRVFQMLEAIIDSGRIEVERAALEDEHRRWISREGPIAELARSAKTGT